MKPKFKIAVIQLRTELEKALTIEKAERMIKEAAANGAKVQVIADGVGGGKRPQGRCPTGDVELPVFKGVFPTLCRCGKG